MKWKIVHTRDNQISIKVDMIESIVLTCEEIWHRLQTTLAEYDITLAEEVTNHALLSYAMATLQKVKKYKVISFEDVEGIMHTFYLGLEE